MLAHFKFRNMKQKASQTCDAYMSQLRLALPECKYQNDSDELLKDQFIFSIYDKEIQDHLLCEIKETDNSVRSLYEARKIESKLAQRKLLGIVTPTAVSVEAIKKRQRKYLILILKLITQIANFVVIHLTKVSALPLGKFAMHVVVRTTLNLSGRISQEGPVTQGKGQMESEKIDAHTECNVHKIHEDECHEHRSVEDLNEQVQSLFLLHRNFHKN